MRRPVLTLQSPSVPRPVEVHVLGSFEALVGGRPEPLGGPRQQAVLARLLIAEGDGVRSDQLVEDVWGDHPPATASGTLHAYVSRLRHTLGTTTVERRTAGYRLAPELVQVDARVFHDEVAEGLHALAEGDAEQAARALESALERWRHGPAFGPLCGEVFLAAAAERLEDLRLAAVEALADARFVLERCEEDLPSLLALVPAYPLRESLVLRLMRALYTAGRPADALAAYERCRRGLADELGVDPAPELQKAYAAVLAQEPMAPVDRLVRLSSRAEDGGGHRREPWSLPARNRSFAGRTDLLRTAEAVLDRPGSTPRLIALHGLGGVGKTEMALELAHRRHIPERICWWIVADSAAAIARGLADLADALDIPTATRQEDRVAALWDELSQRERWLLVLDNVEDPAQVAPFLPPAGDGEIIATSRNPNWRRWGTPLPVTPFERNESQAFVLMRTGAGAGAGGAERQAAESVAELLGDLPLALEHACAYIEQTGLPLDGYARLLRHRREDLLTRALPGAGGGAVVATWQLSVERLRHRSTYAARMLETAAFLAPDAIPLGLLAAGPGEELAANEGVAELLRLSLLDRDDVRLRVHRLVQTAVRLQLSSAARQEALARAITGLAAMLPPDPDEALEMGGSELTSDSTESWDTLAAHVLSLVDYIGAEADASLRGTALKPVLPALLDVVLPCAAWLDERALFPAALKALRVVIALTEAIGDQTQQGLARCAHGEALDRSGACLDARGELEQGVAQLESGLGSGDVRLAHAYNRLGHVLHCAGESHAAIGAHERALSLLRKAGAGVALARVLTDLGYVHWSMHALPVARACFTESMAVLERFRDPLPLLAHTLSGLGLVEQDDGRLDEALVLEQRALAMFTSVHGPRHPDVAQTWDKLGYLLRLRGDISGAVDAAERSIRDLEALMGPRDPRVAMSLTNAGLAYEEAGQAADALTAQRRAHGLFMAAYGASHPSTRLAARRLAAVRA